MQMINYNKVGEILDSDDFKKKLDEYEEIMRLLHSRDVSTDVDFQKKFNSFYKFGRRSRKVRTAFFKILEQEKSKKKKVSFDQAFERVYGIESHCEVSFSSKLAHSINSDLPIWDSVVTGNHFGIHLPTYGAKNRKQKCIEKYHEFEKEFREFKKLNGDELIRKFNGKYPDREISDVKKIDFILWQYR